MDAERHPRLLELRRRVQEDPASIAFAQLAEEYRRAGDSDEAVAVCRAGLQHHPNYLSARVTLGRALIELDRLDDAQVELEFVLNAAADHLAANRALAEVFQKKGQLKEALVIYKKALELARYDPDIEHEVQRIESVVAPPPPAPPKASPVVVEDLFNFDTLIEQLGGRSQRSLKFDELNTKAPATAPPVVTALDAVTLTDDERDPFSRLERQLRDTEHAVTIPVPSEEELRQQHLLDELEDWLAAIVASRDSRPSA